MCGICGAVSWSGFASPEAARLRVEAMLRSLAHRGPDDVGQVATDAAILGVTRLAIRGLQDANQPIVDAETGVIAVCSGEIDNHHELRRTLRHRSLCLTFPTRNAIDVPCPA
jgi:asparagine synthase (glutamine-hydrolysing)